MVERRFWRGNLVFRRFFAFFWRFQTFLTFFALFRRIFALFRRVFALFRCFFALFRRFSPIFHLFENHRQKTWNSREFRVFSILIHKSISSIQLAFLFQLFFTAYKSDETSSTAPTPLERPTTKSVSGSKTTKSLTGNRAWIPGLTKNKLLVKTIKLTYNHIKIGNNNTVLGLGATLIYFDGKKVSFLSDLVQF